MSTITLTRWREFKEMKGPSLDAIRKFKAQQELKKKQEDERKIKEKLSTLEHRASKGDRKAKQELKKIENVTKSQSSYTESKPGPSNSNPSSSRVKPGSSNGKNGVPKNDSTKKRPAEVETDFEELMRLAKQNTNQIKRPEEPKPQQPKPQQLKPQQPKPSVSHRSSKPQILSETLKPSRPPKVSQSQQIRRDVRHIPPEHLKARAARPPVNEYRIEYQRPREPVRPNFRSRYEDDEYEDEDDDYESDGFVVDDEDDDVEDELQKTLKSVFKYDKRRCDLREEEIDRHYRAIGRVNTFEDLEREERRASRLAAAEDAKAFKEEEDRKRMKKLRLQKR